MTKAEARKLIAAMLRNGYYDRGAGRVGITCTRCRREQEAAPQSRMVRARPGKPYSEMIGGRPHVWQRETIREALTRVLTEHLLTPAGEGGCPAQASPA